MGNLYFNGENAIFRDSIVTYVDDLGAKERMRKMDSVDLRAQIDRTRQLASFLHYEGHPDYPELSDGATQEIMRFSDNIVIGRPIIDNHSAADELFSAMHNAGQYQLLATCRGSFMRGAITRGALHIGNGITMGRGLVDAVDAEEKKAVNPRILVENEALSLFNTAENVPPSEMILVDPSDGRAFINYLSIMEGDNVEWLTEHKNMIESALLRYRRDVRVGPKYLWVASYHNYFVKNYHSKPRGKLYVDVWPKKFPIPSMSFTPVSWPITLV